MGWKSVLKTTVIVLILTHFFLGFSYDGSSQPLLVSVVMTGVKLYKLAGRITDALNIHPWHQTMRDISEAVAWAQKSSSSSDILTEDTTMDGVRVRIYRMKATNLSQLSPAVIYYHGGGWVLGSIEVYDTNCRRLCQETGAVIFAVGYRVAPKHTFPEPLDDCEKATRYILQGAQKFGVDGNRIAIAGDSAGGNLAAAVTLRLKEQPVSPAPKLQILIYPVLQTVDFTTPSHQLNKKDPILQPRELADFLTLYVHGHTAEAEKASRNEHVCPNLRKKTLSKFIDHSMVPTHLWPKDYCPVNSDAVVHETDADLLQTDADFHHTDTDLHKTDTDLHQSSADSHQTDAHQSDENQHQSEKYDDIWLHPHLSPLLAPDLSGVPEAYILTCQYDILRDDGIMYAHRLREAGVKVSHHHEIHGYHAFLFLPELGLEEMEEAWEKMTSFVKQTL